MPDRGGARTFALAPAIGSHQRPGSGARKAVDGVEAPDEPM